MPCQYSPSLISASKFLSGLMLMKFECEWSFYPVGRTFNELNVNEL